MKLNRKQRWTGEKRRQGKILWPLPHNSSSVSYKLGFMFLCSHEVLEEIKIDLNWYSLIISIQKV